MPQLSIIVPVYKVEPYLRRCVDSILSQTFTDFELILIDDGSPDNCPAICDEYAALDSRVKVIHQPNAGVSAARNAGLDAATGEYIGFVDSDDWIEPDMYERLVDSALKNDSDMVFCAWFEKDIKGEEKQCAFISPKDGIVTLQQFLIGLYSTPRTVAGSCCNKLIRKDTIKHYFRTNIRICEDNIFIADLLWKDIKLSYVAQNLYHVFARPDSATREDVRKLISSISVREEIISIADNLSPIGRDYAEADYLNTATYYLAISGNDNDLMRNIKKYISAHRWSILRNKAIFWKTRIAYMFL